MNKQSQLQSSSTQEFQNGSIELVVLGLLAALIVVLAFPLFIDGPTVDSPAHSASEAEQAVSTAQ